MKNEHLFPTIVGLRNPVIQKTIETNYKSDASIIERVRVAYLRMDNLFYVKTYRVVRYVTHDLSACDGFAANQKITNRRLAEKCTRHALVRIQSSAIITPGHEELRSAPHPETSFMETKRALR